MMKHFFFIIGLFFLTACSSGLDSISVEDIETPCDCLNKVTEVNGYVSKNVENNINITKYDEIPTDSKEELKKIAAKMVELNKKCSDSLSYVNCPVWKGKIQEEEKRYEAMRAKYGPEKFDVVTRIISRAIQDQNN